LRVALVVDTTAISSGRVVADGAVGNCESREVGHVGDVGHRAAVTGGRVAAKSAVAYDHRSDGGD